MANFGFGELYLKKNEEVCVNGFHVKLSKRDEFMFGFLFKYGFKLFYKCISDEFKGKDMKFDQVGLMCLAIKNIMFASDFQVLLEKRGYRYRLCDAFPW